MTKAQRNKALAIAANRGAKIDDCEITEYKTDQNIAGLPAGWITIAIPLHNGQLYYVGISPEGHSHS